MATIVCSKRFKDHIQLSINAEVEEVEDLKGKMDKIHLISEENIKTKSSIYERGKNGNTKYSLIPGCLRKNLKLGKKILCSKLDCKDKTLLIYLIDKFESS